MATAALVAAALILGVVGPRYPAGLGSLLSLLGAAAGCALLVAGGAIPIAAAAALIGVMLCAALVLPRVLPRLLVFEVLALAFPPGLGALPRPALIAAAAALAIAAVVAAWKAPGPALRLACASLGGRLIAQAVAHQQSPGWWAAGLAALLAVDALLRAGTWPERRPGETLLPPGVPGLRPGLALGVAGALAVLALPSLAPPLPPPPAQAEAGPGGLPPLPWAERRARLQAEAPRGGLVWPLPSEAMLWDEPVDRALFPRVENLDALHLGGPAHGLWRLPGTSLLGRFSLHKPISRQRLSPDAPALARLRAAALATTAALRDVLPSIKPGVREAEIEHLLLQAMAARGCGRESFPLVIAGGPSAAEPHGSGNQGTLEAGTLLVADLGCYRDHYASDFTRTLPVGGRFSPRQRQLYEAVRAAQSAAIAACRPGARVSGLQRGAAKSLSEVAREALRAGTPDHQDHMDHGLGHSVGLFVHDVIDGGPLAPGMVFTIEPGTYWKGELGIRIEDTFVVTKDGCERLTEGFPAEPDAVEAAMAGAGRAP